MKFAFDVDGVILEMPEFFAALTAALKSAGHQVFIVTDFDEHFRQYRVDELARHQIVYDELVITPRKHDFFREQSIDFAIDDDIEYYPKLRRLQAYIFSRSDDEKEGV